MNTRVKFDLMHKVVRELDDLKNSQEAIIKKLTQIEAHNMELGDADLEKLLSDIHEQVADNLVNVEEAALGFLQQTEKYSTDHSKELAETENAAL